MCWRKSNIKTVSLVELENRNNEIKELKSKIDELSKKDTDHVADITKLNNTNLELNVNNTKLLTKIKELNHELEQYKVVNEALTDKVNEFNTDNHDKQILIDENLLSQGHDYFSLGDFDISPDNQWMVYSVDTLSRRIYELFFKNLITGETLLETEALPE